MRTAGSSSCWRPSFCGRTPPRLSRAPAAPTNDDCLTCHGDPGAVRADGTARRRQARGASAPRCTALPGSRASTATPTSRRPSDFPHAEKLARVDCATCHEAAVTASTSTSVHAQARAAGETQAATCVDCHGDARHPAEDRPRVAHLSPQRRRDLRAVPRPEGRQGGAGRLHAVRGQHPRARAARKGASSSRRTARRATRAHEVRSEVGSGQSRLPAPTSSRRARSATRASRPIYERGIHAPGGEGGQRARARVLDCHTAHGIASTGTTDWQSARSCASAAPATSSRCRTYRDTFHGKVTELGFTRVAKCADCHGAHDSPAGEQPALDDLAAGARRARAASATPGANANFAQYDPHADPHDTRRNPAAAPTRRASCRCCLAGVFLFFGIHTLLWFPRSWQVRRDRRGPGTGRRDGRRRWRTTRPSGHYRRFDAYNRGLHLAMMTSFMGLAATGPAASLQPRALGVGPVAAVRRVRGGRRRPPDLRGDDAHDLRRCTSGGSCTGCSS